MKYERKRKEGENEIKILRIKKKPLIILTGILLFCNILWFISWAVSDKSSGNSEEVASVKGKSITREAWMASMEEEIGRATLLELVNEKVMEAAAKKYEIDVTDKEIDFELALMRTVDNQAYIGANAEKERQKLRSTIILEKVLTKDVVIDDKEVKANFNDNKLLYDIATTYRTAIIVLPSKEKAAQALEELSGGSSFDVLARERSVDISSANLGGDIGYVNEETENVDKAIALAASSMKKDTTSDIITLNDGGFAIIHISDVVKGQKFKFKDAKGYIKRELALEQLPESVSTEAFWEEFDAKWFYGNK